MPEVLSLCAALDAVECREHDERNSVQICQQSVDDLRLMQTPQDPKVVLSVYFELVIPVLSR